jgi:hypothetical protein
MSAVPLQHTNKISLLKKAFDSYCGYNSLKVLKRILFRPPHSAPSILSHKKAPIGFPRMSNFKRSAARAILCRWVNLDGYRSVDLESDGSLYLPHDVGGLYLSNPQTLDRQLSATAYHVKTESSLQLRKNQSLEMYIQTPSKLQALSTNYMIPPIKPAFKTYAD